MVISERLRQRWIAVQFSRKQQLSFLEDLNSLVRDGVSVSQAIDTIREISTGITKQIATHISTYLAQGQLLADGMRNYFYQPIVEIIRAGENSGTLPSTLESAIQSLSRQSRAIFSFINSIAYPCAVIVLALAVTVFIKNSVLENFIKIKPIEQWPSVGRFLYDIALFAQHGWLFAILFLFLIIYLIQMLLRNFTRKSRHFLDNLPLLSLYRDTVAARFMETLGLLLSNGITIKQALSILQTNTTPYLSWHLMMMEFRLSGGLDNIADVLNTQLIRKSDLIRLRVVVKGKGFQYALVSLGRQAAQRANRLIAITGKIMGIMLLMIGAFLAATLILGIYTVGSSIAQ